MPADAVPVIDLEDSEHVSAAAIKAACQGTGFFYVKNHRVPQSLIDQMFEENRKAFGLPLEDKLKMILDENGRGYTPFREETLDPANQTTGDTKEGFYFGRDVAPNSEDAKKPMQGPNQWPDPGLLPDFRRITKLYFEALSALGFRMLRLLALALDLPPDYFSPFFKTPGMLLRPLHYAAEKSSPSDGIFGAGAHTDYGMLTILATDDVAGLQIYMAGAWHDVAPLPGTFIINLGDMLERWTNGKFRSTLHRVVNHVGAERYSIAFFFEPSFDALVEVLPQCCSADNSARYAPITAGQHLLNKYAQTHAGFPGPEPASQQRA